MGVGDALDGEQRALIVFAAAVVQPDPVRIRVAIDQLLHAAVDTVAVDELLLQSVLTAGWPRALLAMGLWREISGVPAPSDDADADYGRSPVWQARGAAACRVIYGESYPRLRENVAKLHPALEAWMVTEGYGRTLARPGLALATRELCTVVQTAVLQTPDQLHSHLLGALRAGASFDAIDATLQLARGYLSDREWTPVAALRARVQQRWEREQ